MEGKKQKKTTFAAHSCSPKYTWLISRRWWDRIPPGPLMEIDFGTRLKEVRHLHTGSLKVSVRNPSPQPVWTSATGLGTKPGHLTEPRTAARQSYQDPTDNTWRPEGVNNLFSQERLAIVIMAVISNFWPPTTNMKSWCVKLRQCYSICGRASRRTPSLPACWFPAFPLLLFAEPAPGCASVFDACESPPAPVQWKGSLRHLCQEREETVFFWKLETCDSPRREPRSSVEDFSSWC